MPQATAPAASIRTRTSFVVVTLALPVSLSNRYTPARRGIGRKSPSGGIAGLCNKPAFGISSPECPGTAGYWLKQARNASAFLRIRVK